MHLYDPHRPTINHHLTFLGGLIAIPKPNVMPLENGNFELSLMLPIKESPGFCAKWFKKELSPKGLLIWLDNFHFDPEAAILNYFSGGEFTPNLNPTLITQSTKPRPQTLDLLTTL